MRSVIPGNVHSLRRADEQNVGHERHGCTSDPVIVSFTEVFLPQWLFLDSFVLDDEQGRS
jgi:hypothetical protein